MVMRSNFFSYVYVPIFVAIVVPASTSGWTFTDMSASWWIDLDLGFWIQSLFFQINLFVCGGKQFWILHFLFQRQPKKRGRRHKNL